jgi:hypothetical protein
MRMTLHGRLTVGAALTGVALWMATSVEARQVVTSADTQCVVTTDLERIPVQEEPVLVQLRHTEPVGDSAAVSFPEESRINVIGLGREEDDEPNTLRAALSTTEAVAGEWAVTLRGTAGECTGTVVVGAAEAARR